MRAKKIAVAALSLLLAACIGCLAWLATPEEAPPEATAEAVYTVTDLPLINLYALALQNSKTSLGIIQGANGLEVVPNDGIHYDEGQLRALLYAVCHMTASRRITDESTFSQYGLDAPEASATLLFKDGSQSRMLLLARNPVDGNRYLYYDNTVWLVPESVGELFLRSSDDFISHTIFPLKTSDDYADVQSVSFSFHGNGRDYTVARADNGWALTAPFTLRLPAVNVNAGVLDQLLRLYADQVVASGADLGDYGFDAPVLTVSLADGGQTYTALFAKAGNGSLYMANPADNTVYSMDADTLAALSQDYTALMGGVILPFTAGDVSEIRATAGNQTALFTFSGSGDGLSILRDGSPLTAEESSALISAFGGLTLAGEIEAGIPAGDAVLHLRITLKSGSVENVAFLPVETAYVAVSTDGEAHFVTTKQKYEALSAAVWGE